MGAIPASVTALRTDGVGPCNLEGRQSDKKKKTIVKIFALLLLEKLALVNYYALGFQFEESYFMEDVDVIHVNGKSWNSLLQMKESSE